MTICLVPDSGSTFPHLFPQGMYSGIFRIGMLRLLFWSKIWQRLLFWVTNLMNYFLSGRNPGLFFLGLKHEKNMIGEETKI